MKIRFLLWEGPYKDIYYEPTARMRGIRIYEELQKRGIDAARWDGEELADVIVVQYDPRRVERAAAYCHHVVFDCNDAVFHAGHPFAKSIPMVRDSVSWVTCGSQRIVQHLQKVFDPSRLSYWKEMIDSMYGSVVRAPENNGRILWMGGTDNIQFFEAFDSALERVSKIRPFTMVFCCPAMNKPGVRNEDIVKTKKYPCEFVEWTWDGNKPKSIIDEMGKADISLVALSQTDWARCKSSGKVATFASVGLPVIASDILSYREFIKHGENGFLVFAPWELDEPLIALLDSQELRKKIGDAGQKTARVMYSIEGVVDQFVSVLQRL
jgi:glycosyltransferase involved in cell wall biosynthesis